MSTTTDRLGLVKPDDLELADIDVINANSDKINNNFIPTVKIRSNVNAAIPANATSFLVPMNETDHDSYAGKSEGPMADLTFDRVICRKTGIYLILGSLQVSFQASFPNGYRSLSLVENGIGTIERDARDGNTQNNVYTTLKIHEVVDAIAGDYWVLQVTNTSGGGAALDTSWVDSCFLSATWLGNKS